MIRRDSMPSTARSAPTLFRLSSAFVVHNEHDRELVLERYGLRADRTVVISHPNFDPHGSVEAQRDGNAQCTLLYFGLVRPFKGVKDMTVTFEDLVKDLGPNFELTLVGETWEGWNLPDRLSTRWM
jgi:hypothetical protein